MTDLGFEPVLSPLGHQGDFLREHGHRHAYGLFWEQGTGKTKALIDNACQLIVQGRIDSAIVVAPNGVHHNWVVEELPKHWPTQRFGPLRAFEWDTGAAGTKRFDTAWQSFLSQTQRPEVFGWLCMSYDAMMTVRGRDASWEWLRSRRCYYVLDESQRAKDPTTARTKRIKASGKYAEVRRLASGTPGDKPFDVYSQMLFLDPDFWVRELGLGSFTAFKAWFGVWEQRMLAGGRSFPHLKAYRDLPKMNDAVSHLSSRVLKSDVLDLPPKVYKRALHPLNAQQRAAYDNLRREALAFLDSGEMVTATNALVLQTRLSQITSGFVKATTDGPEIPLGENPRTRLLQTYLEDLEGRPSIMWGRFVRDGQQCEAASRKAGRRFVQFNADDMRGTMEAWKAGEFDDLFGNLGSGMTEGHTLNRASDVFYYSNTPRLIPRLQSEDRAHRIGQTRSVTYTDFIAEGTGDAKLLSSLQTKREGMGTVMGDGEDEIRSWLRELFDDTPSF